MSKNVEQQTHSYNTMMMYEIANMIESAPTAYDVDKVIEQLETEIKDCEYYHNNYRNCGNQIYAFKKP